MDSKRWADPGDLKPCILRSRRRVGWCEFSARLFIRKPCLWRTDNPISDFAAPQERSLSITSTSGAKPCFLSSLRMCFTAAALSIFVAPAGREPRLRARARTGARNHRGHLTEMQPRRWPRASTAKFSGEQRPRTSRPIAAPSRMKHPARAPRADLQRRDS
jgi:hypothetical protein